ncbi:MAG: M20/M25/M40 family metallo-hydrolase [Bacteroidales bacterium]|nr:M20/M25/M40 family metallo-hydrolase [Bacteroidales bacterium]
MVPLMQMKPGKYICIKDDISGYDMKCGTMDPHEVNTMEMNVRTFLSDIITDLKELITIPSVAFPGYPEKPVLRMAELTADLLKRYGLSNARLLEIPGGYPAVVGEIPAPPGAPTVLLYAHYDVQPARQEDGWETDPWTPVIKNGRLYGRGSADNKSGIATIAGTIRALSGKYPVGIRVIIEGEEETASHLNACVEAHKELFVCDLFIITDMGKVIPGEPVVSTTLRGEVSCVVTTKTLTHAVHSGVFGGPAPDALVALIKMLSTLHDDQGDVAIAGLSSNPWSGAEFPGPLYRRLSGLIDGVDTIGTGTVSSRLWSKPSVTVIGIDAPAVRDASNILIPQARARVSLRIAPGADPRHEVQLLADHLRANAPWHVKVEISEVHYASGFICPMGGHGYEAARKVMEAVYRRPVQEAGAGGSIPLLDVLKRAVPTAEFVLWGCEDHEQSRIHGANESVAIGELERMIVTQALLLQELGKGSIQKR